MASSHSFPLSIAFAVLCYFLHSPPFLAAAVKGTELATQVCKNTTDFAFCRETIYSDPRAAAADRYILAYIAFGKAYSNATDTRKYIARKIQSLKSGDRKSKDLKKCLRYYDEAVQTLAEMLGNLDSETYYGLDKLSIDVESSARACGKGFNCRSPITTKNGNLIKLANICYVVSQLYEYY